MSNDKIQVSIEFADQAAQNALTNFISKSGKADKTVKDLGDSGKSAFEKITLGIGKAIGVQDIFVGNLAGNLVTKAFESIKASIGMVIDEAAQSEQSITNLNVALNSAGLYSKSTSNYFQELSGSIQETTKYSDEQVLSTISLLANLTTLNKDGISSATKAAVDLATTLNVDLSTATDMITKAINGNVVAFKKQGIQIEEGRTSSERLANVLKALESQQGAAEKTSLTYAGATEKLKNQQSELFEALGKLYTQSDATIAKTNAMSNTFGSLATFINNNAQSIRDFGSALAITTGIFAAGYAVYVGYPMIMYQITLANMAGVGTFGALSIAAKSAWAAITAPVTLVVAAIAAVTAGIYLMIKYWDNIKASTLGAIATVIEYTASLASMLNLDITKSLQERAKGYRDEAKAIKDSIVARENAVKAETEEEKLKKDQEQKRLARLKKEQEDYQRHQSLLKNNAMFAAQQLVKIEDEKETQLDAIRQQYAEQKALADGLFVEENLVKFNEAAMARLEAQQAFDQQELDLQLNKQMALALSENEDIKRREAVKAAQQKASIAQAELTAKQEIDREKLKAENLKKIDAQRITDRDNTLKLFASMANSNNNTMAAIGKAAAITQIAIDTPKAVSGAFAFGSSMGGPYLGFAFAAIALAAEAALAAQVAGLQFANGGIVPGDSFQGDLVQARVNSGEMVLNKAQQTNLFNMANGRDTKRGVESNSKLGEAIVFLAEKMDEVLSQPLVVAIDGREIVNVTRNQLASGRSF